MADYRNIPNGSSIFDFTKNETCVLVVDYSLMDRVYDLLVADWDGQDQEILQLINAVHDSMKAATDHKLDRLEK
jgi:regulator of sigma D